MKAKSADKPVTVQLTPPYMGTLATHAKAKGAKPEAIAKAMLEAALRGLNPELREPHSVGYMAARAVLGLIGSGETFSGALFLRQPGCGERGLENMVQMGWLAAESGDTYRVTADGRRALAQR